MNVSVKRYLDILMTEDFAERFYFYSRLNAASCKGVPVWYNKDKRYKTLLQKGLGAFADIFQFFFHLENSGKIHLQKMGVFH